MESRTQLPPPSAQGYKNVTASIVAVNIGHTYDIKPDGMDEVWTPVTREAFRNYSESKCLLGEKVSIILNSDDQPIFMYLGIEAHHEDHEIEYRKTTRYGVKMKLPGIFGTDKFLATKDKVLVNRCVPAEVVWKQVNYQKRF
jgi:hypothetical protein